MHELKSSKCPYTQAVPLAGSIFKILPAKGMGGQWSVENCGSRKILVEFHGSRSLVFQRFCESRSLACYTKVSRHLDFLQG